MLIKIIIKNIKTLKKVRNFRCQQVLEQIKENNLFRLLLAKHAQLIIALIPHPCSQDLRVVCALALGSLPFMKFDELRLYDFLWQ